MRFPNYLLLVVPCTLVLACSKKNAETGDPAAKEDPHSGHNHKPGEHAHEHGSSVTVGDAEVSGYRFAITASGKLVAGSDTAVEAKVTGGPNPDAWKSLGVFAWVETADGQQASAPVKGTVEEDGLDFHVAVQAGRTPNKLVLRLRQGDQDVRTTIPLGAAAPAP